MNVARRGRDFRPAYARTSYAYDGASEPSATRDLRFLVKILWFNALLILGFLLAGLSVAFLYVAQKKPIFVSEALVVLQGGEANVVDLKSVTPSLELNNSMALRAIEGEIEAIKSSALLLDVAKKLHLHKTREFGVTADNADPGAFQRLASMIAAWISERDENSDAGEVTRDTVEDVATRDQRVVEAIRKRLTVEPIGASLVISIRFASEDRKTAALIANAIAHQYVHRQIVAKLQTAKQASSWLEGRVAELKQNLEIAEGRIEQYKSERMEIDGQSLEVTSNQIAQLTTALAQTRAEAAERRSRFEQIQSLTAEQGGANVATEVQTSRLIQRLREQQAELSRNEAELSNTYGDKHPRMIKIRSQMADLDNAIDVEVRKIVSGLENDLEAAETRERTLQAEVAALERRAREQSKMSVELRQLQREANAARAIYENFLTRLKETTEQEKIQKPDSAIMAEALPPLEPAYPRKGVTLALGALAGLVFGAGVAVGREVLNNRVKTEEQLEELTGYPVLASVPKMVGVETPGDLLAAFGAEENEPANQAIRNLHTGILLSNVDRVPKSFVVTSSVPNEGKSSIAMMLAMTAAQTGKKTVLVDCDLRRSSISETVRVRENSDLEAVLRGYINVLDAAVQPTKNQNFFVLPSFMPPQNSFRLLNSNAFRQTIEVLKDAFDMVILDTPPLLAMADARVVFPSVESVLFVTRWDDTPIECVQKSAKLLESSDVAVAGVVLSRVDLRKQVMYYPYQYAGYDYRERDYGGSRSRRAA